MKHKKALLSILSGILLLATGSAQAQLIKNVGRLEKKADEFFYEQGKFNMAIEVYQEILDRDQGNKDAILKIAECYRRLDRTEDAERWYRKLLEDEAYFKGTNPEYKYFFALVLESNGKYDEARDWFEVYKKAMPEDRRAIEKLESLSNLAQHYRDSSNFEVERLFINTEFEDFGAAFYANGIVFTSDRAPASASASSFSVSDSLNLDRFYFAEKLPNGSFAAPVPFDENINVGYNEGTAVFYNNGKSMVYTRATRPGISATRYELYFAEKSDNGEEWINHRPFPFNSKSGTYSITHPAISQDGNKLIFSTDMPGGYGGFDLFISEKDLEGKWAQPVNLGEKVNTRDSEYFPFLFGKSNLYFASRGHGGLGGLDIYRVDLSKSEMEVENLGFPINTNKNDYGMCLDPKGYSGFISSDRDGGSGSADIYSFSRKMFISGQVLDLESKQNIGGASVVLRHNRSKTIVGAESTESGFYRIKLEPNTTYELQAFKDGYEFTNARRVSTYGLDNITDMNLYLKRQDLICKGFVTDATTNKPMKGVEVSLVNSKSGYVQTTKTAADGSYIFRVPPENWYMLKLEAPGYFTRKADLNAYIRQSGFFLENFTLKKVTYGQPIVMENTVYPENKSELGVVDNKELDELVLFLGANPNIFVKFRVHTDARGTKEDNLQVAENRATFLKNFLLRREIPKERMTFEAVGESEILNQCKDGVYCSDELHQENRRVEVVLISSGSGSQGN